MVSIDRVYQTVRTLANTDVRGNAKPDELRLLINNSVDEIYESYFAELNRSLWRENIGRVNNGIENVPDRIREKLLYFHKDAQAEKTDGKYYLPDDVKWLDSIIPNRIVVITIGGKSAPIQREGNLYEICKGWEEFTAIKNTVASKDHPICIIKGNEIYPFPPPGTHDTMNIQYLRKHKIAKWTFTVINGNEVFNPGANDFQDIDLHPSEEANIIVKTLQKLGVNLKEQDIVAHTSAKEQQEFQHQNS